MTARRFRVELGGRRRASQGDELLVAIGRTPAVDGIGARVGRASSPAGSWRSTTSMRVPGSEWLYAVGDVNGRSLLTHMGKYQARVAARRHPRHARRAPPRTGRARRA